MNEAKRTTIQLIKYGIIGVSNTLITLVAFYLLNTIAGLSENFANAVGYILGVINSFIWNRNWVFKTKNNWEKEALLFGVGFLICFGMQFALFNYLLAHTGIKDLEISWMPMKNTGENVAMGISMVVYTLANYCYNRFITFKSKSEKCGK